MFFFFDSSCLLAPCTRRTRYKRQARDGTCSSFEASTVLPRTGTDRTVLTLSTTCTVLVSHFFVSTLPLQDLTAGRQSVPQDALAGAGGSYVNCGVLVTDVHCVMRVHVAWCVCLCR